MLLKNKETGEIIERYIIETASAIGAGLILQDDDTNKHYQYNSLAEFCEEWEDAPEEPKEYWTIDGHGKVHEIFVHSKFIDEEKEIGNYFSSREEAEKAVEKLKAWKRLKDRGFEFTGWDRHPDYPGDFRITASDEWTCDDKDLDLLFGGGE